MTRDRLNELSQENAALRRAVVDHPAVQTLRFIAPFVRDAIEAGTWKAGMGTESIEHELAAALSWADRLTGGE